MAVGLPITSIYIRCVLPIRCEKFNGRGRQECLPYLASLSQKVTKTFLPTAVGGRLITLDPELILPWPRLWVLSWEIWVRRRV